jgi:hypothetical protein
VTLEPAAELKDQALSDEICLLGDLMLAAGEASVALSDAEVDTALGLSRTPPTS